LWHGIGLFAHNQWTTFLKSRRIQLSTLSIKPLVYLSTLFTFIYVSLGWVWFALPQPADAMHVLRVLFGAG
jgi:D-alanyl-lipoteichoic acid acyltransferase DltB (MBOAT superfamily)